MRILELKNLIISYLTEVNGIYSQEICNSSSVGRLLDIDQVESKEVL